MKRSRHGNAEAYGTVAVFLHWVSAVLVLAMLPLGFLMQGASVGMQASLYWAHLVIGVLVFVLTLARVVWKFRDSKPEPHPELAGLHLWGLKVVHFLLHFALLVLSFSGVVLVVQSGLLEVLQGGGPVPDLSGAGAREPHGVVARIYIGLLVAHIGGVVLFQVRHGGVLSRMGIGAVVLIAMNCGFLGQQASKNRASVIVLASAQGGIGQSR